MRIHDKTDLNAFYYFVHIVEKQGFAAAGRALSIPKSRLSRHLQQLEESLGTRLIQRTSRQFVVTEAGMEFFQHAKRIVEEIEAANNAIKQRHETIAGRVRFTCSVGIAHYALAQSIPSFLIKNPKVVIDQLVTNEMVDLIGQGIDFAIRGHFENLKDSTFVQNKLVEVPWRLFASPKYLQEHGVPFNTQELSAHAGLMLGWNTQSGAWHLKSEQDETAIVNFIPRLRSDDMGTLKQAAVQGLGIASLPEYVCRQEVASSQLMRVLPNLKSGDATITALMPSKKGVPPAVKTFLTYLKTELRKTIQGI